MFMSAMVQIFSEFMRWKMKCSIQWGKLHFIFHQMKTFVPLHEWENIHYLFYITSTKIQILKQIEKKKKALKNDFSSQAKHFTSRASNFMR